MNDREPDTLANEEIEEKASESLQRLLPRLDARFSRQMEAGEWAAFRDRLDEHFGRLFGYLYQLYGQEYDFFYYLENILGTAADAWRNRPAELKALDAVRERDQSWFQSRAMIGASCYVDRFAGNLAGLRTRIPYLSELGIRYLHLMPLFLTPDGDDDGGYAVSSYREVDPALGTTEQLAELATELRNHGISLVVDFVFNHTSDEHEWARRAYEGEEEYQEYYRMFPDRTVPDQYEQTIRPVFQDDHPGCFTYRSRLRKWVWTTFHNYQWDLNYENPAVFDAMAAEMLHLANVGVEVLRLDAVAFLWKRIGTSCENLPEAHLLIRAFNALVSIAAPALVFKSEAIVHPDEVLGYIDQEECPLSYNPQLMALLWEALATRDARLLRHAMEKRFELPGGCAWAEYVRCHDDIGWAFSDDDARELGIDPQAHRRFLNDFYTGDFEGSFAAGLPFQEDEETGEGRVSGTTASLCGVERALESGNLEELDLAIRRVLLLHAVTYTVGGIPLLYLGDEIGVLNDYDYREDPEMDGDSRWVHRPVFPWDRAALRADLESVPGRVYGGLLRLAQLRKQNSVFSRSGETQFVDVGNDHVLGYFRLAKGPGVLVLANFTERAQEVEASRLRLLGLRKTVTDVVSGTTIVATDKLVMDPYQFVVLLGVR